MGSTAGGGLVRSHGAKGTPETSFAGNHEDDGGNDECHDDDGGKVYSHSTPMLARAEVWRNLYCQLLARRPTCGCGASLYGRGRRPAGQQKGCCRKAAPLGEWGMALSPVYPAVSGRGDTSEAHARAGAGTLSWHAHPCVKHQRPARRYQRSACPYGSRDSVVACASVCQASAPCAAIQKVSQQHTKLRSPYVLSTREQEGQNLWRRRPGTG